MFSLWLVLIVKLYVSKNTSKRTPYADHQAARILMIEFPRPSQWNMIDFFQMIEVELVNTGNISIGHSMLFLTAFAMLDSLFPFILCSLWANARSKLASTSHENEADHASVSVLPLSGNQFSLRIHLWALMTLPSQRIWGLGILFAEHTSQTRGSP